MKKTLKIVKRWLLDENDVSKTQKDVTPQEVGIIISAVEAKSDLREKNEITTSTSVTSSQSQNDKECAKHDKKLVTAPAEKETQEDKEQSFFWRRRAGNNNCRLFLGGFPDDVTEAEVKKVFEKYGRVVDIKIPLNKDTNKFKRYGFLEFLNEDSAKACLDDHFVSINGKRVEVKTAWPRGSTEKTEKSCDKKTKEVDDREKFPSSSVDLDSMTERSMGSSCTDSESNMGDSQVFYQKLFENYFKAKFFLENLLNQETVNDAASNETVKKQHDNEKEIEKILNGLYISNSEYNSEEEEEEDDDDTRDFASDSEESSAEELEYYSLRDSVESFQPNQAEATRLLKKNEARITCDLCEWAPLDNSDEGFLAHCRTLAHKQKLRERFKKKETPDYSQNKGLTPAKEKAFPEMTKRRRKHRKQNPANKLSSGSRGDQKNKNNMKLILHEIMSCIEAKTDKCIKCKVCNKIINHSPDIQLLMANLSHHIQSKGHLAKIEKLIQKQENAQEMRRETEETSGEMRGNTKEKTPVEKAGKHLKNTENNGKSAGAVRHLKLVFLNKTNETTIDQPCKKKSTSELNSAENSKKFKFRCLPCNYYCSRTKTFLDHLKSQSHNTNEKQTSLKTSADDDFTKCLHCNTHLYGSFDSIKNHIATCKKPK